MLVWIWRLSEKLQVKRRKRITLFLTNFCQKINICKVGNTEFVVTGKPVNMNQFSFSAQILNSPFKTPEGFTNFESPKFLLLWIFDSQNCQNLILPSLKEWNSQFWPFLETKLDLIEIGCFQRGLFRLGLLYRPGQANLQFRFYVKSFLESLEVLKLLVFWSLWALNFGTFVDFSH